VVDTWPVQGVVSGGVTGVQGEDDVDVAAGVGGLDRAHRELEAGEAELTGQAGVPGDEVGPDVDSERPHPIG